MTEHLRHRGPEREPSAEAAAEHQPKPEKTAERAEVKPEATKSLESIRKSVGEEAHHAHETKPHMESHTENPPSQYFVNKELKSLALQRILTRVRKQLSAPEKVLSKIVHAPAVDAVSRAGEKTVARPSGLLGGSICAFLGSLFLLYISKRIGFEYNFLVFVMLFVGGFAVGMVIEIGLFVLVGRRRKV